MDDPGSGWTAIDSLFKEQGLGELLRHQIESFDYFVSQNLEDIINGFNCIEVPYKYNEQIGKHELIIRLACNGPVLARPMITEKNGYVKPMSPQEARLRNFTYAGNLHVDVTVTILCIREDGVYDSQNRSFKRVLIGKIPIMVGSNYCMTTYEPTTHVSSGQECMYDKGGYFIINGNEKVVISQDRVQENRVFVFPNTKSNNFSHVAEIRSVVDNVFSPPKLTLLKMSSRPNDYGRYIRVNIHHVRVDIPLFILFRAFGVLSDKDIIRHVVYDTESESNAAIVKELHGSIHDAQGVYTKDAAMDYITRFVNAGSVPKETLHHEAAKLRVLAELLEKEVFPHVGMDARRKAIYLGYMTRRLIKQALGMSPPDDRDSYISKRVDSSGMLLGSIFRQYYAKMTKEIRKMLNKELHAAGSFSMGVYDVITSHNIGRIIKSTIIESGLKYALSTGIWGLKTNKNTRHGVAQVLNRMTFPSSLSHLRRNNTPVEKSGKMVQPRRLHATQFGIICPAETPEGASVGVVKNMALTTHITVHADSHDVRALLEREAIDLSFESLSRHTKVFVNGDLIGATADPSAVYSRTRFAKRSGAIGIFTSVAWNRIENVIVICTEAGRYMRPLFVIEDGRCLFTKEVESRVLAGELHWHDLVRTSDGRSCVEYMDVAECSTSLIAMQRSDLSKGLRYTHMELHPSMMLGVLANIIPFSDRNQSPRNSYQSAMGKQAIGIYALNFRQRFDTLAHVLNYPQKPLVATRASKYMCFDSLPNGANAIVAIMTYTGFNQEDAVIVNRSSLERGLFNSTFFRTMRELNNRNHATGEEEFFCSPIEHGARGMRPFNYSKLGSDGFVPENTYVRENDVLIGKCMPVKIDGEIELRDASVMMKNGESGYVDMNCHNNNHFTTTNGDGYEFAKVRVRSFRMPTIGDKVSSRHGQKGTIGIVYTQEDMPFTRDGLVPDVIINPHAVPSRMTVGQLMECILGKVSTIMGCYGDGTPFSDVTVESIGESLRGYGYEAHGNEVMYDGRSGEMMRTSIFIGPTYYQRLKHMVCDKVHCLTMDHEVLTEDGWRCFEDLDYDSRVATLTPDGRLVYQQPASLLRFDDFDGEIATMASDGARLSVTEEHRMVLAAEGGSWKLEHMCKLLGRDVHCVRDARWDGVGDGVGGGVGDADISAFGTYVAFVEAGDTQMAAMDGRQPHGYVPGQRLPAWLFSARAEEASVFLAALFGACGDGRFETMSRSIADDVQRLCLHAGTACDLDEAAMSGKFRATLAERRPVVRADQIRWTRFRGSVFCLTVPNQVFYVRRGGRGAWTGNSRAGNGPLVMLTRQPAEGRARDGGLRFGEMEVLCVLANGILGFMKERFVECSDGFPLWICARCHRMAIVNTYESIFRCPSCKNTSDFCQVRVPFAMKLLLQECSALAVDSRLLTA
jgi:DNA-directed RNA polymerase II subunit RPB2